ncbi:hypothetical protein JAAARDRAFT_196069 [Jaapia argillacea MUCL 33604]|uniref:Uncharacterized protein n=1 Tax=Jaapia argillacea MUCL 33604 TaxID=933084 RepID=A0A067PJY1_9AGAM|nr:hypothetical protein JAAARDRAFT_196069 [Jaapia argillacea MUCL 33604]
MISQAALHTLSVILTPSIHLPAPPSFYVTADNQPAWSTLRTGFSSGNTTSKRTFVSAWAAPEPSTSSNLTATSRNASTPYSLFPSSPSNKPPPIYNLDYTEACPKSLCPLLPIIQAKPTSETKDVFGLAPLLLENTQPRARSLSYHPSTPVHSPHPSDYQLLEDMEIDEWNGCADYASPPLVPTDASSSDNSLPSLRPISSIMSSDPSNCIGYSTPSLTTK